MPETSDKMENLRAAVRYLDAHPDYVVWQYVRAALAASGNNISDTARKLGMHRRSLQRLLTKDCPPRHPNIARDW